MVVGWYHSHPGFGCWLSGVDINTQQSFEALNERAVSIVVDPIQSVKGKVVIDNIYEKETKTHNHKHVKKNNKETKTNLYQYDFMAMKICLCKEQQIRLAPIIVNYVRGKL